MTEMTAADIAAVTRNNMGFGNGFGYGYGMDGQWIWVVVLFALFGGGFGWGNRGGNADGNFTRSDLQDGFNTQSILSKLDSVGGQITSVNNGLCDGFYETTKNLMQGQNQLSRDLCQGFSAINSSVLENRFTNRECCCETNRNIDNLRYDTAKQTCDIVRAIEKDGEATRALINANEMQNLRDKLAMQSQIIQTKDFALSQQTQNEYLVNKLKPCAIPAYVTCSPYESAFVASRGYGYNGGCGCGNY